MYLNVIKNKGVDRLYLYETIRVKDPKTGKSKTTSKMIESLGRLDDLQKKYEDPIAHFKEIARQRTEEKKSSSKVVVEIDTGEVMSTDEDNLKNVGYGILKELYKQLEIDKFWNWKSRKLNVEYSIDQIFRLLVFGRALYPGSKKHTYENRHIFFEGFDGFDLDDVYYALDIIARNQEALQEWIFDHSKNICERDLSTSYFDCTNYYFDIGRSDMDILDDNGNPVDKNGDPIPAKYRKRGPEKNHRPDPIVEMGLMIDRSGIPVAYDLFPGNESEKVHMRPIVNRMKERFSDMRIIFVADRGLNTSDNIYWLNGDNRGDKNSRDGYVYGQSIRGATDEFKSWVLSGGFTDDKIITADGSEITFRHKSRIFPKEIHVNVSKPEDKKRHTKTVIIDQKQMVYYSEKYARKQKADRDVMIARATDLIAHPKKYDKVTSAGSAAYVKNISFNKTTGEIVDGTELSLDMEKIAEDEKYDGFYSIVTSELEMSDHEMRDIYRGLAKIEDTFKISKTEFSARPVYVSTNDHIDAHFSTCFTALVLIRLLQTKLGNKYPVGKILESLRKYNCTGIDRNLHQFIYYDEILDEIANIFSLDLNSKYRSQEQVRRLLRY
jgi:hypothetical protein